MGRIGEKVVKALDRSSRFGDWPGNLRKAAEDWRSRAPESALG